MRKPIRSFVVETTKSRHEQRSTNGRASFVTMLADAEPKFRDHPAFNLTRDPEPAITSPLDRPAPKRVLEALVPASAAPEPVLAEPIERKRGRPRKQNPVSDVLDVEDDETPSRPEPVSRAKARSAVPAVKPRQVVAGPDACPSVAPASTPRPDAEAEQVSSATRAQEPSNQTASRRGGRIEANGASLKPGQRWMAHLPKSTQKRLLGRPRNAR